MFDEPYALAFDKAVSTRLWAFENDLENKRTEAVIKTMVNIWTEGEKKEPALQGKKITEYTEEELKRLLKPKEMGKAKVINGHVVDYFDEHGITVTGV